MFLRKDDVGDIGRAEARGGEAVGGRAVREIALVFPAGEALLLARGDQGTVHEQRGIRIVAEQAADAEADGASGHGQDEADGAPSR